MIKAKCYEEECRMKKTQKSIICLLCIFVIMCINATALSACNDTVAISNKIYIDDFSGTYTISVKAKVKNHSTLPNAERTFEYNKSIDELYATIIGNPPYNQFVHKKNDIIFVDIISACDRVYSCIIYKSEGSNTFTVHSLTYTLGGWANHQAIFFPAYSLNKEISPYDTADTVYQCSYDIETLKEYYIQRGYYAEIQNDTLKVVCLLIYPSVFKGEEGQFGRKAISWSIVYEDKNTIRFADVSNQYV